MPCSSLSYQGGPGRRCDAYGLELGRAKLPGGTDTLLHDACCRELFGICSEAGLPVVTEPATLFSSLLSPSVASAGGIVPDATVEVALPAVGDTRRGANPGRSGRRRDGPRVPRAYLFDGKTLHGGGGLYFSARARDEQSGAVEERAHQVPLEYRRAARALDLAHSPAGTSPILHRLATFTPVRALVFGHFGECSADVYELLDAAAERAASRRWRALGSRTEAEARGYFVGAFRRRFGVHVTREFARHRLRRLPYVGATRAAVQADAARRRAGGGVPDPGPGMRLDDFYVYQAHLPHAGA